MSKPKYIDANKFWNRLISVSENDWVGFDTIDEVLSEMPAVDVVEVCRCAYCIYWDRETLRYQRNDFRSWNEAECQMLAERDGYNEINRYTEADDYCSYGERRND